MFNFRRKTSDMNKLINDLYYDTKVKAFKTSTGFLNIFKVTPRDLKNITAHEKSQINMAFVKYFKTEPNDIKMVALNYPTDTTLQSQFFEYKKKQTTNAIYHTRIDEKSNLLTKISSMRSEREFYFFVFTKNLFDFKESEQRYSGLVEEGLFTRISDEKKKQILYKYNNMNSHMKKFMTEEEKEYFDKMSNIKTKKEKESADIENEFITSIQPQGGISFTDEQYVKTGNGYCGCVTITDFPKFVSAHWLGATINLENCITTVDITNTDNSVIRKNIDKSIKEQASRIESMKDYSDKEIAKSTMNRLKAIASEINSFGESIKKVIIRIYVSAKTKNQLDKNIAYVRDVLDGKEYDSTVYLNSSYEDWTAFYKSYSEQYKNKEDFKGTPFQTETLARGNPFHFTSLSDPCGSYLGRTTTGGSYLFDYFHIDELRTHYNSLILGLMGKGKSTTAKWILEDVLVKGNKIRAFDPNYEYSGLAEKYGGVTISLGSSDSTINPLQIFKADEKESTSFSVHISKLKTIFKIMTNTQDEQLIIDFQLYIEQFYSSLGLSPSVSVDEYGKKHEKQITGLANIAYPVWSDFINYLEDLISEIKNDKVVTIGDEIKSYNALRIEIIKKSIQSIVNTNRDIFDHHTAIEDINNKQFVIFDTKNIRQIGGDIFRVQLFLALSFCWQDALTQGFKMKEKFENKEIDFKDISRTLIILEECADIVNTDNMDIVSQLAGYSKEARKYFVGFMFITQSIRDFASDDDNERKPEGFAQIKRLFDLTQNKFIFEQPASAKKLIRLSFGSELTESLIDRIPELGKGSCVARLSKDSVVELSVYVPEKHLEVYKGGA